MVESKIPNYEVDPFEPINVKQKIKFPTDNEVPRNTKPSQVAQKPKGDFEKLICYFCKFIANDPIQD